VGHAFFIQNGKVQRLYITSYNQFLDRRPRLPTRFFPDKSRYRIARHIEITGCGKNEAARVLRLPATYHRDDLVRALERATHCRAYSWSAVERISPVVPLSAFLQRAWIFAKYSPWISEKPRRFPTSPSFIPFAQHLGERGDIPKRKESLLKGETARKRLGIPMFMGTVR
jgi:hypothetical protein